MPTKFLVGDGGFSDIVMMKYIAFGMIFALAFDATIVRMLLVPAVMHLLREDNWWAPRFLTRLTHRLGGDSPEPVAAQHPAVAAAPAPAPAASQVLAEEGASASTANEAAVRGDRSADTDEELIPFSELVKRLNSTDGR